MSIVAQDRIDRGVKRICGECQTRFYDMMRSPPTCPKCGTEFVVVARPLRAPRPKPRGRSVGKPFPALAKTIDEPISREDDDAPADDRDDEDGEADDEEE